jgi:glycosyltransferase involved in cell wall biosynthesis
MSFPRFSVVIPTHNGEAYLAAAIDSVLSQTYPHFDILVLEHESTDRTREIVRSYADPRVHLHATDTPQTIESNWARILTLDLAEYLTILGHDDLLYPDFLHEITQLITQRPDASLYITHFDVIDAQGRVLRPCKPIPTWETGEAFMRARQHFQRDIFGTGYVMRSADYIGMGGFPPFARLYFSDDYTFYRLADLAGKACSPRSLFGYRYHPHSESYMSGLEILADATQQFMAALEQTPYARNADNWRLAHAYVNDTFTRRTLRILIHCLQTGDTRQAAECQTSYREFVRRFPSPRFSRYALAVRVLEMTMGSKHVWLQQSAFQVFNKLMNRARGIKS